MWSVFAADSELDQLLKFSAFGRQSAGRDALDVRLRLIKEIVDAAGAPFELQDLTCRIQMQIPSIKVDDVGKSDGNLIVPTTANGAGFVKVEAVAKKQVQTELAKSLKV